MSRRPCKHCNDGERLREAAELLVECKTTIDDDIEEIAYLHALIRGLVIKNDSLQRRLDDSFGTMPDPQKVWQ